MDEVGRGPIAGPVVSCCVRYNGVTRDLISSLLELQKLGLTDSKKLTQRKRLTILKSLGISVGELETKKKYRFQASESLFEFVLWDHDHQFIDQMNILQASLDSMACAAKKLRVTKKDRQWVDGNKIPKDFLNWPGCECYIKGDSRSGMIALASIIAKEWRDHFMERQAELYPHYGFEKHAGYPTKYHKEAVKKHGPSPIHRLSFKGVREYVVPGAKV